MAAPRTLFDRIWQSHVVVDRGDGYHLLYVDRHLMHDGSGPGFAGLRERGLKVRRPELALATPDHYTSTAARTLEAIPDPQHRGHVEQTADVLHGLGGDPAELGLRQVEDRQQGRLSMGIARDDRFKSLHRCGGERQTRYAHRLHLSVLGAGLGRLSSGLTPAGQGKSRIDRYPERCADAQIGRIF